MRRTGLFTNAAIGALLVVPALTLQGRSPDSLEGALQRTLGALETLADLEQRVAHGDREALGALLASTEPARDDPQARDLALVELRGDVSELERELDGLHGGIPLDPEPTGAPRRPDTGVDTDAAAPIAPTTGLDDATRRLLAAPGSSAQPPAPGAPAAAAGGRSTSPPAEGGKQSFEPSGYAADPLVLARALYRQGRWNEALALLEGRDSSAAMAYWRARCLEKLERDTEAIEAYGRVIDDPNAGWEGERAREDLEFLQWRLDFARRRAATTARKEPK